MQDRSNDIEVSGVKIKDECLLMVQKAMSGFPSIRFLYNPIKYFRTPYYEIAYGGKSNDVRAFEVAIQDFYWNPPEPPKRTFFQKLFNI
jgi:hypothetical protein